LIAGGEGAGGAQASTELYDPAAAPNSFATDASLLAARADHVAIKLDTHNVLVAGGWNGSPMQSAEIYDTTLSPNQFRATGGMAYTRQSAAAAKLQDGRVLITGGFG